MARNTRITIRARDTGRDEAGQPRNTWHTVCEIWADVRHPSGLAAIRAEAQTSIVRASMSVCKRDDIKAGMQAVDGADVYEVEAILPDKQNRLDMFLVCKWVK